MERFKQALIIFLLLVLSLPAVWPLFHSGFFQSDDGEWMVIRFSAFHQALTDGQFPVRFLGRLNHGYGYPVANFLYPGFMYLAEIPKILGFGFVNSIKIILGLSMVGSAIFTYLWLEKLFSKWAGVVGAGFYLLAPYHLFDLYKRGSVGEILALAVAPFVLWQVERKSFFWTTIGIALLILSHNTLALLFLPIILLYGILRPNVRDWRKLIYQYTSILVVSVGLASFFWIPAIFDLQYTRFSQIQVSNWQDYFVNFNLVGQGAAIIYASALFATVFPRLGRFIFHSNYLENRSKIFYLFLVAGLGSVFLALPQSSFIWRVLPVGFVQFPFRFLSVALLSGAYLAAYLLNGVNGQKRWGIVAILVVALFFPALPYSRPSEFFDKGEGFYATNEGTTTVQDEYMPKWVKIKPTQHFKEKVEIIDGQVEVSDLVYNSKKLEFNVDSIGDSKIRINTIYFPGWKAFINDKESTIDYNNDFGVMDLSIPNGEHKLYLSFTETPTCLSADILSILSLAAFLILTKARKF